MKIAQIATVGSPVRFRQTGSIELLVWTLTEHLIALGHDVTVFATADSQTSGRLISVLEKGYTDDQAPMADWKTCEWMNLCAAVERASAFDVLHSHAYLYGLPLTRLAGKPFVHTYHVSIGPENYHLVRQYPNGYLTAISKYQWSQYPDVPLLGVIHHGLDTALIPFSPKASQAYLCYLGRFIPQKGPHLAIEVARKVGLPLIMAGERTTYFTEKIAPLVDGTFIQYVGPVYGQAKWQLLGGAHALVYPLASPEPFGLVLIEAMLCGTPVAALGIGAVPEVVDCGITGYYAKDLEHLAALMPDVLQLDRAVVRQQAEKRFSAHRMANEYAEAYTRIVQRSPQGGQRSRPRQGGGYHGRVRVGHRAASR